MHTMEVLIEGFCSKFSMYATVVQNVLLRIRRKGRWIKVDKKIMLEVFMKKVFIKLEMGAPLGCLRNTKYLFYTL